MKRLKRFLKMLFINPNSPEGLRIRRDKLIVDGFDPQNPMVTALAKMADLKEEEQRKGSK